MFLNITGTTVIDLTECQKLLNHQPDGTTHLSAFETPENGSETLDLEQNGSQYLYCIYAEGTFDE